MRLNARVAELVDALDLGSSVERRVGSSPSSRKGFGAEIPDLPNFSFGHDLGDHSLR